MYDAFIQFVGLIVIFCVVVTTLFYLLGLTMDFAWRKMQDAVSFYRLSRCWKLVSSMRKKQKGGKA